jgi:hypothetical protein
MASPADNLKARSSGPYGLTRLPKSNFPCDPVSRLTSGPACDQVLLVLLDNRTLEPREMWEAPIAAVEGRLALPGSRARERGGLGVREFRSSLAVFGRQRLTKWGNSRAVAFAPQEDAKFVLHP